MDGADSQQLLRAMTVELMMMMRLRTRTNMCASWIFNICDIAVYCAANLGLSELTSAMRCWNHNLRRFKVQYFPTV